MIFENEIQDMKDRSVKARAEIVIVAYDFRTKSTIPVPEAWRKKIMEFEGL
jgi:acyl-CoA thioesterase FadM